MNQPPLEPGYRWVDPREILPTDAELLCGGKWDASFYVGQRCDIAYAYRTRTEPLKFGPLQLSVALNHQHPQFEAIQQAWLEGWTAAQQPNAGPVQAAWLASKARKVYQGEMATQ